MVSFEVHWPRRAATWLGLLAALAVPCGGSSQPPDDDDEYAQLAEQVLETQTRGGAYAKELIDPLTTLSFLYEENGDHSLAAAVTEQALQVIRANYGLRTLEQAPLIRQRIASEEARGNFEEAWVLEHVLLDLARKNPDDLRAAPIFHEVGDKRLDLLARYVDGERPPQIEFGCYYRRPQPKAQPNPEGKTGSCTSGLKHVAVQALLLEVQTYYASGINTLRRQQLYSSDELHELETKLLRSTYLYGGSYEAGKQSLQRRMAYDVANTAPLEDRIETLLQIADWELLFGNRPAAQELYEQVHSFLQQHGGMQHLIDEIFSPATPVVLPTFVPSSLAADPSPSPTGHIDVAFEITQYGKARRIEILDTTRNASTAARHRLVRLIGESRFRPRIVDGQFARAAPVVLRDIPPDVTVDEQPIRSVREVGPARRHDAPEG